MQQSAPSRTTLVEVMAVTVLSVNCPTHHRSLPLLPAKTKPYLRMSQQPPSSERIPQSLLRYSASAVLFLGLNLRLCFSATAQHPPPIRVPHFLTVQQHPTTQDDCGDEKHDNVEQFENEELKAAFEAYKSKAYALSVPLKLVALRGSIPPSWVKDFIRSQGKRLKFHSRFHGSLEEIFNDLSMAFKKGNVGPTSTVAADMVTVGDSWLNFAIKDGIIEPISKVEDQDWYKGLSDKWKVYLRRNHAGKIDPEGEMWAVPYRWGCMVIAYKQSKFQKHKLAPIEDWADLWRPELAGRISMVNSPREVIGAVLKFMGASYNTRDINLQVAGGRNAVQQNLALLRKQVRLFDGTHYLKAFSVGDVWVAVGWSSDVLPVVKRMSNVTVVVPKSGASLWADLWAIPAASRLETNKIGGRVRGPSPLIHEWIEFCLQAARSIPFVHEVIPGAVPSAIDSSPHEVSKELSSRKPKLDTNLIAGVPPPEIMARCEFLEPLPDATLSDYQWLIDSLQKPDSGLIQWVHHSLSSLIKTFWIKLNSGLTPK